jgi:hypothetical protein
VNRTLREQLDDVARHVEALADIDEAIETARIQRRRAAGATAAVTLVCVALALGIFVNTRGGSVRSEPMRPAPGMEVGAVPVWFDAAGLHRGDVVEKTPVRQVGALALVRTGALYQDADTREVWFHPWGGEPRVVGDAVNAGPGGDPEGDTAAWFEDGKLVVYDTVTGQASRFSTSYMASNCPGMCAEHYSAGSHFLEVSDKEVAWNSGPGEETYVYDLTLQKLRTEQSGLDAHGALRLKENFRGRGSVVFFRRGGDIRVNLGLEPRVRFSPDGRYFLSVEPRNHDAVIVSTTTARRWYISKIDYPFLGWSYEDIALIQDGSRLLSCDASSRGCDAVPVGRRFVMPTT